MWKETISSRDGSSTDRTSRLSGYEMQRMCFVVAVVGVGGRRGESDFKKLLKDDGRVETQARTRNMIT
jgi:hypothetical protein